MDKTRILLVDDHAVMRMGLTALIASEEDLCVVGEAESGEQAVEAALRLQPDIIIMDLMLPGISGAEATRRILGSQSSRDHDDGQGTRPPKGRTPPRILILTTFGTSSEVDDAIANGATAVITKDIATHDLIKTIRNVRSTPDPVDGRQGSAHDHGNELPELTDHQLKVLTEVARGFSNPEIADILGVSVICIKKHMQNICNRLGAANRSEAIAIAMRKHLLKI